MYCLESPSRLAKAFEVMPTCVRAWMIGFAMSPTKPLVIAKGLQFRGCVGAADACSPGLQLGIILLLKVLVDNSEKVSVKSFALGFVHGFFGVLLVLVFVGVGLVVGIAAAIYICGRFEVAFWGAMVIGAADLFVSRVSG